MQNHHLSFNRRRFVQLAAGTVAVGAHAFEAMAAASKTEEATTPQPSPAFTPEETTAEIVVDTLIAWGATHAFGLVGDGINSIIEAFRKRRVKAWRADWLLAGMNASRGASDGR